MDFHEFCISKLPSGTQTCLGHGGFWENQPLPRNCHPHPVPRVLLWVVGIFPGSLGRQASQKWKISNMAAVLGALVTGWRMAFWRCPKSGYPNSWMVSIKDNPIFIMEKYEEYSGTAGRSWDINGYSGQIIATSGTKAWNHSECVGHHLQMAKWPQTFRFVKYYGWKKSCTSSYMVYPLVYNPIIYSIS